MSDKNKENDCMKLYLRLILSGALLLALALTFAACSGGTQVEPSPVPEATEAAVVEASPAPTEPAIPVLEIVGESESKSLTMDELKALPVTEGYAGIKSSTGKITPPVPVKGVALKDLAELIGGMDETKGFNVVAEDGYSITYSNDQIQNGAFIAYDPATGAELKNPVALTAILTYEVDGKALDPKQDGTLRLAIVSAELNQVTDGHWAVKWVNKLEVKNLGAEWALQLDGAISKPTDRASIESCGAPQCHGVSWVDDKAQEWAGVPLYYFVGSVDDEIEHEGPAFNRTLADAGYSVDVIAADGYTVTFDAARVQYNKDIIVAYKVNGNQLPDEFFPLRLVGDDLSKKEMAGMIAQIKVGLEPLPATEAATAEAAATEAPAAEPAAGSFVISGLVNQEMGFMEADLRALEVLTINAEHPKNGKQDFEGVSLNTLLDMAGVKDSAKTLFVTSADGYTTEVALSDVRACTDCLLGFTNTAEKFKLVMPNLPSNTWAKEVVKIEVK
jgi:DMSO/TMAO reductase YedYZ molybdopterin-dependent catalytic subunit